MNQRTAVKQTLTKKPTVTTEGAALMERGDHWWQMPKTLAIAAIKNMTTMMMVVQVKISTIIISI